MMKNVNFIKATATIMLVALSQVTAISQICTLNQSSGSIVFMEDEYVNNMHKVFYINTGVNKPVEIELNYDIELYGDYISIYEVDNAGNEYLTGTYTGEGSIIFVRTTIPNGKAKFVFHTDVTICGEDGAPTWASGTYYGIECYFYVDNTFATAQCSSCNNLLTNNLWVSNNAFVNEKLGIGTFYPQYQLDVNGIIRAKEVIIETNGADFVFDENYQLRPLNEVQSFIKENKHLPEILPASQMQEKGMSVSELNVKLLQKIEELTLYLIQQATTIEELKSKIAELERK